MDNEICNYSGCTEQIRDEDKTMKPETKKYCVKHGQEIDAILKDGNPAEILRWWVRSMGIMANSL